MGSSHCVLITSNGVEGGTLFKHAPICTAKWVIFHCRLLSIRLRMLWQTLKCALWCCQRYVTRGVLIILFTSHDSPTCFCLTCITSKRVDAKRASPRRDFR